MWESINQSSPVEGISRVGGIRVGPYIRPTAVAAWSPDCSLRDIQYLEEQKKDRELLEVINFLQSNVLPKGNEEPGKSHCSHLSSLMVLCITLSKRVVVPRHLCKGVLEGEHSSLYGGHFSGRKLYSSFSLHWWWEGLFRDVVNYCNSCPECAITVGTGRTPQPPLCPIPINSLFQIWGVDIMDLPKTDRGNQHAIVFQDLFTKWPTVFPAPDQKQFVSPGSW